MRKTPAGSIPRILCSNKMVKSNPPRHEEFTAGPKTLSAAMEHDEAMMPAKPDNKVLLCTRICQRMVFMQNRGGKGWPVSDHKHQFLSGKVADSGHP